MGGITDAVGGLFDSGADAAGDAAGAQVEAARLAVEEQRAAREQAREDLSPFREVGQTDLQGLGALVTDPNAQADFINNNPFFNTLADKAQDRLFANQAAKGKLGSGGTLESLQNSLVALGSDLLNQNISQRQNLATLGSNAAATQASTTINAGNSIADLLTQQGNAQASGIIGAQNAKTNAFNNLAGTAAGLFSLCDRKAKTDIEEVGRLNNGLPVYKFRYKGGGKLHINVMAQDVEKVKPDAVVEVGGLKHVNMEKATCL